MWKLSKGQGVLIRQYAQRAAHCSRVKIEPGVRVNLNDGRIGLNMRLISDQEDWGDTDLHDHMSWADFVKEGVELTPNGRGCVDLYVYEWDARRWSAGDLGCNAQLYIEDGQLVRLESETYETQLLTHQKA